MVIINPSSGKEKALEYEKKIIAQLHNYEVIVKETTGEGDATRYAKKACDENYDTVILVGGDGTLNEGINGIAEQPHRPVVGIVPLGTVNDFARALNISLNPDEAIALLGGGTTKADIGKVNNKYFTNIIAIGSLAEAVGEVTVEQKTSLGAFAYLFEGVKAAIENDSYQMEITANGQTYKEDTMLFICVLTNSVGSFRQINKVADTSDGLLHGIIIKSTTTLQAIGTAKNLITGNHEKDDNITKFEAQEIYIQADKPIPLNVDGDLISQLPVKISVLHNHIEFYCNINDQ